MKLRTLAMLLALTVGGCASQVPLATNYPLSTQKKVRSSHHWDVIADDVAQQTVTASKQNRKLLEKPIFVKAPGDKTSFNQAFRNFLVTRMVNRGISVSNTSEGAQEVQYELQLVRHDSSRYSHIPGTLTSLTAGISVIRDIFASSSSAIPASLGLSALADFGIGYYSGGPTPTELIVTTSILDDKNYIMRKSDIYYIEDADTDLFVEALERPVKQWQLVGGN